MTDLVSTVLMLFCLFLVKHMFADYFMQTPKMLNGRGQYWHLGRAHHAAIHMVGSMLVFAVVGTSLMFLLVVCFAEWIIHFHIDWAKARHSEAKGYTPIDGEFWRAFGIDQTLHGLTYVAMIWLWVVYVA